MIRYTIRNLRGDWQAIDLRDIKYRIVERRLLEGEIVTYRIVPWTRDFTDHPQRSYVLLLSDGSIYAIYFRRVEP